MADDQHTAFTPSDATDDLPQSFADAMDDDVDAPEYEDDEDLEFCGECYEPFRYDDCGGYNPPCICGFACRNCCDGRPQFCVNDRFGEDDDFDVDEDE
jgi:hypothetical protein